MPAAMATDQGLDSLRPGERPLGRGSPLFGSDAERDTPSIVLEKFRPRTTHSADASQKPMAGLGPWGVQV